MRERESISGGGRQPVHSSDAAGDDVTAESLGIKIYKKACRESSAGAADQKLYLKGNFIGKFG